MACIGADGSALKPEIIIPRKTVDADLVLTGLTAEKVSIRSQLRGFVDTELFDSWLEFIFLPELAERRRHYNYTGPAILLLDNCSAHKSARFQGLCEENRVLRCYRPPHSSNQLQPLDLSIFGITKRFISRANMLDSVNIQTRHIANIVCAFLAAAVPSNIVNRFELSGNCLVADEGTIFCVLRPKMAKRRLSPLPAPLLEIAQDLASESDDADIGELEVFIEECADLLYDLEANHVN
jgi:hypothetical protein